jgi:predicted flap endonuclease-1-like 5' DNA nuclease
MRKHINSAPFVALIMGDIEKLKATKDQYKAAKKLAKNTLLETLKLPSPPTKEERASQSLIFVQAKIRYKLAKVAYKAARKKAAHFLISRVTKTEKIQKPKNEKALTTSDTSGVHYSDPIYTGVVKPTEEKIGKDSKKTKQTKPSKDVEKKSKVKNTSHEAHVVTTTNSPSDTPITKTKKQDKKAAVLAAAKNLKQAKTQKKDGSSSAHSVETLEKNSPVAPHDLTLIEGIGPKIKGLLELNGIKTFQALASSSQEFIKAILKSNSLGFTDPSTWPQQAGLAADGKMGELEKLKKELKGGRKV